MDTKQHEWRKLPEHERERRLFFEDKAGDRLLHRSGFEEGTSSVSYRYWNGRRAQPARQSEASYWKQKSEAAQQQSRANLPRFLKPAAEAAMKRDLGALTLPTPSRTRRQQTRYFDHKHAAQERNTSTTRTRFVQQPPPAAPTPTPEPRKRRYGSIEIKDLFDDVEPPAKRLRTEGLADRINVPTDTTEWTPYTEEEVNLQASLARRQAEFMKKTQASPNDVTLWLQFAAFQDDFAALNKGRKQTAESTRKGCEEKRIEVLEMALRQTENRTTSVTLWAKLADSVAKYHPDEAVEDVWEEALEAVQGAPRAQLWLEFMTWMKTRNFTTFSIDTLRDMHKRALLDIMETKHRILDAGGDDTSTRYYLYSIEEWLVRIVNSAATLERQAGYPERGLALFQIMLAMNALMPDDILASLRDGEKGDIPFADRVDFMDAFWAEDSHLRLGETATRKSLWEDKMTTSTTINEHHGRRRSGTTREVSEDEVRQLIGRVESRQVYEDWLGEELAAHLREWYPVRPDLEKDMADANPDRVVFLEDVEQYLVPIYERGQHRLLFLLLLEYLSVPALFTQAAVTDPLFSSTLLSDPEGRNLSDVFADEFITSRIHSAEREDPVLTWEAEGKQRTAAADTPLDVVDSFLRRFEWTPTATAALSGARLKFVANILTIATEAFPGDPVFPILQTEVWGGAGPKEGMAAAKRMLAKDKNNHFLWLKYAHLALQEGTHAARTARSAGSSQVAAVMRNPIAAASKIYTNLLTAEAKKCVGKALDSDPESVAFASLCRGYVETVLLAGELASRPHASATGKLAFSAVRRDEALHILCCAAGGLFTPYATASKATGGCTATSTILVSREAFARSLDAHLDRLTHATHRSEQDCLGAMEVIFCAALLDMFAVGVDAAARDLHPRLERLLAAAGFDASGPTSPAPLQQQHLWVSLGKLAVFFMQYAVCTAQSFEPTVVGRLLQKAAEALPQHPVLTALHCEFELLYSRAHKVRLFFAKVLETTAHCPLVYLYATYVERRCLKNGARAQQVFSSALGRPQCRSAAALWVEMLRFQAERLATMRGRDAVDTLHGALKTALEEGARPRARRDLQKTVSQAETSLAEVRGIFYRAIADVPGCILVWLQGLRLLGPAVSPTELKDIVDLIHEKHLHVRVFVEEVALDERA